jgi:hypothetical protein
MCLLLKSAGNLQVLSTCPSVGRNVTANRKLKRK